jgi:DNA-binding winged helix-turn-helix (wHTH) protein/Tol biopolymer transport system component
MSVYRFAEFRLDTASRTLERAGTETLLPARVHALLVILVEADGDAVSKESLIDQIWPNIAVSEQSLSEAVWQLRRALDDNPRAPRFVQTVPRFGFRFVAKVEKDDAAGRSLAPPSGSRSWQRRAGPVLIALAAVLSAVGLRANLVRDTRTSLVELALPGGAPIHDPEVAISRDSTRVAFVDPERLQLMLLDTGTDELRTLTSVSRLWPGRLLRFSPDGTWLAYVDRPDPDQATQLRLVDINSGDAVDLRQYGDSIIRYVDWMLDSRRLVVVIDDQGIGALAVLDLEGNEQARVPFGGTIGGSNYFDISPDGRWLAHSFSSGDQSDVFVHDLGGLLNGGLPVPAVLTTGDASRITIDPQDDYQPVWSPGGGRLLWVSFRTSDPELWTARIVDGSRAGEPQQLRRLPGGAGVLREWLPGDRIAAFGWDNERDLYVVPLNPTVGRNVGEPKLATSVRGTTTGHLAWARNSDALIFKSRHDDQRRGDFYRASLSADDAAAVATRLEMGQAVSHPVVNPSDGSLLFLGEAPTEKGQRPGRRTIWRRDPDGSDEILLPDLRFNGTTHLTVDAAGTTLLFNMIFPEGREPGVYALDLMTRELARVPGTGRAPAGLSPDGRLVVFESDDFRRVEVVNRDGSDRRLLYEPDPGQLVAGSFTFSPDGVWVAFPLQRNLGACIDFDLVIVNVADGTVQRQDAIDDLSPWRVRWSPDGSRLAFAGGRCRAGLWLMQGLTARLGDG